MFRPRIVVVGSINLDLVFRAHELPRPGETISGHSFRQIPGGKGANQAVGAARLGADVAMVGRVGDDSLGTTLLDGLKLEGIDVGHVIITQSTSSGLAIIGVDDSGQNSITVIPGANGLVSPNDVVAAESVFKGAQVLLVQFEIPLPAVHEAIRMARKHGVKIVLDPAPACANVPIDMLQVDAICPNETEAESLCGFQVDSIEHAISAARRICSSGIPLGIITMGSRGAVVCAEDDSQQISPFCVDAIDSTAAGDAFASALGIALAEHRSPVAAVRFACAAGALAASRLGAQPSMPTRSEVESLLSELH